jgi:glycosyltransferase involved in cell wall biosynthesis
MVQEYLQADALLFASLAEGFGLPIIEAQATGRLVVTSNIAPMTEVAGEGAIFVDPRDPSSIRRGICLGVEDASIREHAISAGLRNVRRYSASAVAAMYADVYREVAGDGFPAGLPSDS